MESKKTISYSIQQSAQRMDDILNNDNSNFSDKSQIPSRDKLTYNNGYYVDVTAIFIDIVGSSNMTDSHKRPTLAKMYRSFISECVAIFNSYSNCKEVNIHGDCVWGVFDISSALGINGVFEAAATINSMINLLNYKLAKKNYSQICVGIGIDYGRALMAKAGYFGSGINDVIWMGDVINSASHICNKAGRNGRKTIIVSNIVYDKLNEHNKGLLKGYYDFEVRETFYEGDIIIKSMEEWIKQNCK